MSRHARWLFRLCMPLLELGGPSTLQKVSRASCTNWLDLVTLFPALSAGKTPCLCAGPILGFHCSHEWVFVFLVVAVARLVGPGIGVRPWVDKCSEGSISRKRLTLAEMSLHYKLRWKYGAMHWTVHQRQVVVTIGAWNLTLLSSASTRGVEIVRLVLPWSI